MAIGTSLGAYFSDELHMHMNPFLRSQPPVLSPGQDQMKDQSLEESPDTLVDKKEFSPTYWKVNDFHSSAPSDD